MNQAYKW